MNKISALILLIFFSPLIIIISYLIYFFDGSPVFFRQKRCGKNNSFFYIYKFRTMKKGTPDLPTHLLNEFEPKYIRFGLFLRNFSLDELGQLFNIIKGDMNFIGPRPALFNQYDLISMRAKNGIDRLKPGITGWAQVNGRDKLGSLDKVKMDKFYLNNESFLLDIKILFLTILKVIRSEDISS